jgi:hypothetical protein
VDDRIQSGGEYGRIAQDDVPVDLPRAPAGLPWGLEQALASVALGAVFAIMAFPTFLMIQVLGDQHFRGWAKALVIVAAVLGSIGGLFVLVSAMFGLIFGILGMGAARRAGRSVALAFAGVLLNSLDLFMWLGALIGWIATVADRM